MNTENRKKVGQGFSLAKSIILQALKEDIGKGDITTQLTIPANQNSTAKIIAKQDGVLAGSDVVRTVFTTLNPKIKVKFFIKEGEKFKKGETIAELKGNSRALLTGERTALNFLCRLSGIATLTRKFVDKISHTKAKILDTRKTTPNLRILEKYAVKVGGGENHRFGLYDMILIKDNHIKAAGGITNAVLKAQKKFKEVRLPKSLFTTGSRTSVIMEVETKNIKEVKQALELKVPMIMLDNMKLNQIRKAVRLRRISNGKAKLEVSGGVNLRNVRKIAETGVDYISVGALTHSAPIIDMSMKTRKVKS